MANGLFNEVGKNVTMTVAARLETEEDALIPCPEPLRTQDPHFVMWEQYGEKFCAWVPGHILESVHGD